MRLVSFFLISLLFSCVTSQARGLPVVYSATLTGADIFSDPNATFPTRTPALSGTSLVFGPGAIDNEVLFTIPILPAGTITTAGPPEVSLLANLTRVTTDFDPALIVSDGTNASGVGVADNSGGTIFHVGTSGALLVFGNMPAVGNAFDVQFDLALKATSTDLTASLAGAPTQTSSVSTLLDATSALGFFLRAGNAGEEYQLNSLNITVTGTLATSAGVPEPSTLTLASLGFLALIRRRRRK